MPQPATPLPPLSAKKVASFWRRVDKTPGQGPQGTCWEWQGGRFPQGYGRIIVAKKQCKTSRVSWFLANGEDPGELLICHTCDNPPCCNPAHLFKGTVLDNSRDMVAKGRHRTSHVGRTAYVKGEAHGRSKLTAADVQAIRRRHAAGETQRAIAADYNIAFQSVCKIIKRQKWSHV
jgi:hypothetical protein